MSDDPRDRYEVVIGLEVHTHLATETKLFSPAPVRYGEEPNHAVSPIDLGLPGVLPVLNERVIDLAIRLGLAIHGTVNPYSVFARKNFFYPDLPKGYQISQYELPVVSNGWLEIHFEGPDGGEVAKKVAVTRAHLEEDTGKSIHDTAVVGRDETWIDYNRCGVPLLEIVSEPDLRSSVEAGAYLRALRQVLRYTGVSEADMEKGQFRCDANVSLRRHGASELGTRTELKNINSFRFVEAAIDTEVERQAAILDDGGRIVQATLGFDPDTHRIRIQRVKENASDYRYFPDPDLIPLHITPDQIEAVRKAMPELPDVRFARFVESLGLAAEEARILTEGRELADFFEAALEAHAPAGESKPQERQAAAKRIANWMLRDVMAILKERACEIDDLALEPVQLGALVTLVESGRVTAKSARELLPELATTGGDPAALVAERGLEAVQDTGLIDSEVDAVLAENPDAADRYRAGDAKVLNFLMGQVMRRTRGKANPGQVRKALAARLAG